MTFVALEGVCVITVYRGFQFIAYKGVVMIAIYTGPRFVAQDGVSVITGAPVTVSRIVSSSDYSLHRAPFCRTGSSC